MKAMIQFKFVGGPLDGRIDRQLMDTDAAIIEMSSEFGQRYRGKLPGQSQEVRRVVRHLPGHGAHRRQAREAIGPRATEEHALAGLGTALC